MNYFQPVYQDRLHRLLFLFLFFIPFLLPAQTFQTRKDLDGRDQKLYERAMSFVNMQQWAQAREELDKLLERSPNNVDVRLTRAGVLHDSGDLAGAAADYEQALALAPDFNPLVYYQLALTEQRLGRYDRAVTHFEEYLRRAPAGDNRRARAEKYLADARVAAELRRSPVDFRPTSLGDSINTPGREYLPSFTADGEWLIYTVNYNGQEDFYFSRKENDGWRKGQPLTGVNTPRDEAAQTISADGRLLVLTGCYWPEGKGSCDLYYTERRGDRWTQPRNFGAPINSSAWESQPSLSANGRALYFSSDRRGGKGENDIYVSYRRADGSWGAPTNLGDSLNTSGNDESPFIHADDQTLYFMSDGHSGLGGYDLFVARRREDGQWGKPRNLGYPINTEANEGALVVSLDGETAYYTLDQYRPGETTLRPMQNLDIYQFPLPAAIRPQPVTYVKGQVKDATTGRLLSGVKVDILADNDQQAAAEVVTDTDGAFLLVLPAGRNYGFSAQQEGYLFYSDRFELAEVHDRQNPYRLNIELQPLPAGATATSAAKPIILRNVLFATGSAEILPASAAELERLRRLLANNPGLKIQINGHTDNVGSDEANQQLSEARARAVYDYLVKAGITAERLAYKGFGESRPLDANDTPEGRAMNRRTEFEIVKR